MFDARSFPDGGIRQGRPAGHYFFFQTYIRGIRNPPAGHCYFSLFISAPAKDYTVAPSPFSPAPKLSFTTDGNGQRPCENTRAGTCQHRCSLIPESTPSETPHVDRVYDFIAAMKGCAPIIWITRFMLYANTCKLISVLTRGNVLGRKCVAPIQAFNVLNGCSAVWRLSFDTSGC